MDLIQYPRMLWSSHEGWDKLARARLAPRQMFRWLVLPMSLLPPLMIVYASTHIGPAYFPEVATPVWWLVALQFFALQLLVVPLMAWAIQNLAKSHGGSGTYHDAFNVAAVAPVPLWLSSLVLLQNEIWLVIVIPVLALGASAALIMRGVEGLLKVDEDLDATDLAVTVIALGALVWFILIGFTLIPFMIAS